MRVQQALALGLLALPQAGGVGLGLVWGWLLGSLEGRVRHPEWVTPALGAATLATGATVRLLAGWRPVWFFLGAVAVALFFHAAWRQQLRARFKPPS